MLVGVCTVSVRLMEISRRRKLAAKPVDGSRMLRGVSLQGTARQRSLLGTALALQVMFSLVDAFGMTFNTTYTTNILPAPSPLLFKPYINQIAHRPNVKPTIKTIDASGKHVMNTSKMTLTSTIVHDHQREDNAIMTMQ